MKQPPAYLSYLLRLWQSGSEDRRVWRASLESPLQGERLGFTSLKELFAFLETQAEKAEAKVTDDQTQATMED